MRIGTLPRHEEIYICGTGPSMRVFPIELLKHKITIGLNQFWRYLQPTYSLTVHPELLVEYEREIPLSKRATRWIVKRKPPLEMLTLDDDRYHVFHTSDKFETVVNRPDDTLFIGRGVQQTAMDLASRLGAKVIYLVGIDMGDLGGDHHGHDQHVRFHGLPAADVYREYRHFTATVRNLLRVHHGTLTATLSPLLGATAATEDYLRLCKEYALPKLPTPKDTSAYKRNATDA